MRMVRGKNGDKGDSEARLEMEGLGERQRERRESAV